MSVSRLSVSISAHSWNGDKSLVAVCPNSNEINIYRRDGDGFDMENVVTLQQHDAIVTSIAWAPNTNRILSCSQDRNAYVWTQNGNVWEPTLVILRINRAATECRWSPKEDKFAVASGDKCVSVCYFEDDNNWWVSKHIKKELTSTILSVDWHPNNVLLATGGSDKVIRIFSGFVKGIDNRKDFAAGTAFGKKLPFSAFLASFPVTSWVHRVRWSPSGNQLAWTTHDSTIGVLTCADENHYATNVPHNLLPLRDIEWAGEGAIIGAGFDCFPVLFQGGNNEWSYSGKLDAGKQDTGKAVSAMDVWKNRADTGKEDKADQELESRHQNSISVLSVFENGDFATSGLDGNIVVWNKATACSESGLSY